MLMRLATVLTMINVAVEQVQPSLVCSATQIRAPEPEKLK